jgi:hypothetical protein
MYAHSPNFIGDIGIRASLRFRIEIEFMRGVLPMNAQIAALTARTDRHRSLQRSAFASSALLRRAGTNKKPSESQKIFSHASNQQEASLRRTNYEQGLHAMN